MLPTPSPSPSPSPGPDLLPTLARLRFPPITWYVLGAALLVLLSWLIVITVRYLVADPETRASIRQAFWIRRRWHRLARALSLVTTDRVPTLGQTIVIDGQRRPEPKILTPSIRTKCDPYGVHVTVNTVPGVGLDDFQKNAAYLADAWGCVRVGADKDPDKRGRLLVRAVRIEPLARKTTWVPDGKVPTDLSRWHLGLDEYARPAVLHVADVPGMVVGGLPGKGKSALINALISRLAPPVRCSSPWPTARSRRPTKATTPTSPIASSRSPGPTWKRPTPSSSAWPGCGTNGPNCCARPSRSGACGRSVRPPSGRWSSWSSTRPIPSSATSRAPTPPPGAGLNSRGRTSSWWKNW
ncbi:hypothetical protein ACFQ2M_22540 [Kitasatospora saccharophila]|uniref:hypothetical protein n=1 Tax=Kitasatospora saccharophila TaxID=407973 RepID=UPI00363F0CDF